MSEPATQCSDRDLLENLLIEDVTQGLSSEQRRELDLLLGRLPPAERNLCDPIRFERAAAAADFAFGLEARASEIPSAEGQAANIDPGQVLPGAGRIPPSLDKNLADLASSFQARVLNWSKAGTATVGETANVLSFDPRPTKVEEPESDTGITQSSLSEEDEALPRIETKGGPRPSRLRTAWWLLAAAALLAVAGWWPRLIGPPTPQTVATAAAPAPLSLRVPLAGTGDPAGREAIGVVEWSDDGQSGVLRIERLAANDPSQMQYQLWIFDRTQDERYPIDGGVFNIPPGSEGTVVIPIDAKLRVQDPTLFAITVEKPGGVVVSSRERIVLAGSVA